MITENELKVIQNIAINEMNECNGGNPKHQSQTLTWVNCVCEYGPNAIEQKSLGGIMQSLSSKGLVVTNGEVVELSYSGFEIYLNSLSS